MIEYRQAKLQLLHGVLNQQRKEIIYGLFYKSIVIFWNNAILYLAFIFIALSINPFWYFI